MRKTKCSKIGLGLCTALLGVLTGWVGCVERPRHEGVYMPPPPGPVATVVVAPDDYVYYPAYQVYYSSNRRQYVYREGRNWVSRPAPPRVSAEVLFAAPSVRLDFHDSPALHHKTVVRQYPRNWAPPGPGRGYPPGNRNTNPGRY